MSTTILMNIIRGALLWLFLPFALYDLVVRHKAAVIITLFLITCVATTLSWARGGEPVIINDLTAAFNTNIKKKAATRYIVLHHTAGGDNGTINDICKVHFGKNKWSGLGYHFFINNDGTVYQLRDTSEAVPHSFGYNNNSVAICMNGNFSVHKPTDAQWEAALTLVRQLLDFYGLDESAVYKHGDLAGNNTECCGTLFDINEFKNDL